MLLMPSPSKTVLIGPYYWMTNHTDQMIHYHIINYTLISCSQSGSQSSNCCLVKYSLTHPEADEEGRHQQTVVSARDVDQDHRDQAEARGQQPQQ